MSRLLFLFILLNFSLFAQKKTDSLTGSINVEFLEKLVKEGIDQQRVKKRRKVLLTDTILYKAAKHHSNYLRKKGRISHKERSRKFSDPQKRVNEYGGKHFAVGENVASTFYLTRTRGKGGTKIYYTYEQLSKGLVKQWMKSTPHRKNLLVKNYTHTAVAITIDPKEKAVYAVQKFAWVRK